ESRGEKEFGTPEGRRDVVRQTFRAHASSVREFGVHRIVRLLSVTRHKDSAWYHQLLVILWHLNSNRGAGDSAFAGTLRSIEILFFKTCRTSPRAGGS